jgi:hypothetical protein
MEARFGMRRRYLDPHDARSNRPAHAAKENRQSSPDIQPKAFEDHQA